MRYRRFGISQFEVSEVGFGTWTLASDWWGKVDDKTGFCITRAWGLPVRRSASFQEFLHSSLWWARRFGPALRMYLIGIS